MHKLLHDHHISFVNAWAGLRWALASQPNFRIHSIVSILVLWLSSLVGLSAVEYAIIIFAIILGFSAELINTAIEAMTDLITTEWRKEAKIAKDVSAGMMLFVAMGTATIAVIIIAPKLFDILSF